MIKKGKGCSFLTMIFLIAISSSALAKRAHPEKWYQQQWCQDRGGQVEAILPDRSRCDCLTDTHAIKFDFGENWTKAIGQALYYAIQTNKIAGIVLILEKSGDYKYWIRLNTVIDHFGLPIETWMIGSGVPYEEGTGENCCGIIPDTAKGLSVKN